MSTSTSISVSPYRCDTGQTIAFGSLSGSYTAFTNPISHGWRIIDMVNSTDADCWFSFDGTTDNVFMPAGSFRVYDLGINGMILSLNTQMYARTTGTPTKGLVSITGGYQRGT